MKHYLVLVVVAVSFFVTMRFAGRAIDYFTKGAGTGRSFFVDSVGGSDINSGRSETLAFKTLQRLEKETFLSGDSIYLKKGTELTGEFTLSGTGTLDHPILVSSYGQGASPIINATSSPSGNGITVSTSWITIENLEIKNAKDSGVNIEPNAHDIVVKNNTVSSSGFGFHVRGYHNLLTKNTAKDLKMIKNTVGGDDDYGAVGFFLENKDNEISYNKCFRCKATSYDYGTDGGFVELYGTTDNSLIHHNYAEDTNGFIEVGSGSTGATSKNVTVAYNISYNNREGFLVLHLAGNFITSVSGMRVENNTIYYNLGSSGAMSIFQIDGAPKRDTLLVKRNIIVSNIPISNVTGFTREENIIQVTSSSLAGTLSNGEILTDPMFVNPSLKDFHLKSTSRAIDISVYTVMPRDYDGVSVPQEVKTDAGAFEYSSSTPTATPPPTQGTFSITVTHNIKLEAVISSSTTSTYVIFDGIIENGIDKDVDDISFKYSSNWSRNATSGSDGTPAKYTSKNGELVEFSTKAKSLVIRTVKHPQVGSMKIYVDGALKQTVSGSSSTLEYVQIPVSFQ